MGRHLTAVECIWPANALLGEAPFWDVDNAVLYWVDIDGCKVFRFTPSMDIREEFSQTHEVGCIVPRQSGGFVAGIDCGIAYADIDLAGFHVIAAPEKDIPGTRFNDGKCDRRGRLWVASADRNEREPLGALYRLENSGTIVREMTGIIVGNGFGWSLDDKTMYFTDTGVGTIFALDYDIETGQTENRRVFAQVDQTTGFPDGLTVDAEGFVWSAHWQGWRITRYDPDGRIDRVIDMPVPNVTSLAFGGKAFDRLYVTTARSTLSDQELREAPLSGGLFVVDAGVSGLPETCFDG